MKVNLKAIQQQVKSNEFDVPTGDAWFDNRYQEDIPIIGHVNSYYRLFHWIVKNHNPGLTVELGSYWATAASAFASPSIHNRVITIDIHREDKRAQQKSIEAAAHYPNLTYLNGWTWDDWVVKSVKDTGRPIDILYIDAWHDYQYAIKEWQLYSPMLADEALVICDDIFDAGGATEKMVQFWNEIGAPYKNFVVQGIHAWIPMGFLRYAK